MADRPALYAEWATDDITEVKVIDGVTTVLDNKLEPSPEWKISGEKYRQNLPRQYVNYNFNLLDEWIKHLDERYVIGDVHLTTTTESVGDLSTRLGGTWEAKGTQALGSITVKVYEKTGN